METATLQSTTIETTMTLPTTGKETTPSSSSSSGVIYPSMTSLQTIQSGKTTWLMPSPTTSGAGSSGTVVIALVVVLVLLVVIVLGFFGICCYLRRRKQRSHSFHKSSSTDHVPTFRALSTWEEAVNRQEKDVPENYPTIQFSTPDLIAGTSDSDDIHGDPNGRLRNDTITTEISILPPLDEVSEPRHSTEFENPGFEMELDGELENTLLNSPILSDVQDAVNVESENEKNLSKSPNLLQNVERNSDSDMKDETNDIFNEEDDNENNVSTENENNELSIDLQELINDNSFMNLVENDNNSPDVESGIDNTGFEIDTEAEGDGTSSETPRASPELDISR